MARVNHVRVDDHGRAAKAMGANQARLKPLCGSSCRRRCRRTLQGRSEVVLDLAEITDCKRVEDHQVLVIDIVDLVSGVTRYEQHSSGVDAMHHTFDGDRSAS